MLKFNVVRNNHGEIVRIETALSGPELLCNPKLNKGCAFSREERAFFHLDGLLPHYVETLDHQVQRMYAQYSEFQSNIAKNIYLNVLHDYNETLFYRLVKQHIEEMLPIIYTPTVGEAVERYSLHLRKPRGMYISYQERNQMEKILENVLHKQTHALIVTDGEAVLGIGDQGIGGIEICKSKLMVYTLCGGINPNFMLPIQLDTGTNNPKLLADPMYLGWRHERITAQEYDNFIDQFVTVVKKKLPHVYIHWEDLGRENASRVLKNYRKEICTINGDMQSTAVATIAALLAGCIVSGLPLTEHRIVIFGSGAAGLGIADELVSTMQLKGLTPQDAKSRLWLIDKYGLITKNHKDLLDCHQPYARSLEEIAHWKIQDRNFINLQEVVTHVKPTILIGCSAVGNAFSEEIIKTMASQVEKPIIMPLSNPTPKSEAKPEDLLNWTQGRAIIATGSPFPDVKLNGRNIRIAQSNNSYAFPGVGLGAIIVKAKQLSDGMLLAATETLSSCSPVTQDPSAPLMPLLSDALPVSKQIALAVAEQAKKEGLAQIEDNVDLNQLIKLISWEPTYYSYRKI